ncbi:hypothetical protein T01_12390 [Trichinella spiralis]|uniref:Uncharacterized protein n=1 Tax=Trichinella spiralis TaxID=6334 RepID=A0A0V0Z740_TRISP|nr:hypothetical protein T01_12390 [Trichinella spiralis]
MEKLYHYEIYGSYGTLHYNSLLILTFCVILIFALHVINEYRK